MSGVDFERDFPQPPSTPEAAEPRRANLAQTRRVQFANPEQHRAELVLDVPLMIDGRVIEALVVERPTAALMVDVLDRVGEEADDETLLRHVIAAMCSESVEVLEALFPDDAGRVAAAALPFLPASLVAAIERREVKAATADAEA